MDEKRAKSPRHYPSCRKTKLLRPGLGWGARHESVKAWVVSNITTTTWRSATKTHTEQTNFVTRLPTVRQNSPMITFVCQSVCDGMSHAIGRSMTNTKKPTQAAMAAISRLIPIGQRDTSGRLLPLRYRVAEDEWLAKRERAAKGSK